MPFKSAAQRRYLYSQEPEVAKKFAAETPKGKKLPERIHPAMKQAMKKFDELHGSKFSRNACKHCK